MYAHSVKPVSSPSPFLPEAQKLLCQNQVDKLHYPKSKLPGYYSTKLMSFQTPGYLLMVLTCYLQ